MAEWPTACRTGRQYSAGLLAAHSRPWVPLAVGLIGRKTLRLSDERKHKQDEQANIYKEGRIALQRFLATFAGAAYSTRAGNDPTVVHLQYMTLAGDLLALRAYVDEDVAVAADRALQAMVELSKRTAAIDAELAFSNATGELINTIRNRLGQNSIRWPEGPTSQAKG